MGAGLGTGFAGMSAAAVISPMLITFLGIDPYMAVGIALASDVLASAVSAVTYKKNKNLDVKNGLIMMVAVLVFTVVGSFVSSIVPVNYHGKFFGVYDPSSGYKIHSKAGYDHKGADGGGEQKTADYRLDTCGKSRGIYLRICGCRPAV